MATTYKLSYTAKDIDEKLGKIDNLQNDEEFKSKIVQQVINIFDIPVYGIVDSNNNNITLVGNLTDGTYTIKYEDPQGNQTIIGVLKQEGVIAYTNVIPTSIGYDGTVFNGTGYMDGYRLTGSQTVASNMSYLTADSGYFTTGFFPYTTQQVQSRIPLYVKGVDLSTLNDYMCLGLFDNNKSGTWRDLCGFTNSSQNGVTITQLDNNYYKITPNSGLYGRGSGGEGVWTNCTMGRICLPGSGAGVILTVGEPIE